MTKNEKLPKFIITGGPKPINDKNAFYNMAPIDQKTCIPRPDVFTNSIGEAGLEIGDIVICNNGTYVKQRHINCEPAIVTGTNIINIQPSGHIKMAISAFCIKYGDITITLDTDYWYYNFEPFIYTQRGDTILVQRISSEKESPKFEILANPTVVQLRTKFIKEQQAMQANILNQQNQK